MVLPDGTTISLPLLASTTVKPPGCRRFFRREVFDMNPLALQVLRCFLEGVEHRGGPAAVEVPVRRRGFHRRGDIQHPGARLPVEIETHPGILLEPFHERRAVAHARTEDEFPIAPDR